MRVHQAGSHLTQQRGAEVEDWSWRQTRRRIGTLWRLTSPYRLRTGLSVFSLLTATATALAPPYLAKLALDDAVHGDAGARLWVIVGILLAAGLAGWGMTYVEPYFTGWVGERILADLRTGLFEHLQRLSLGFYERNRAGVVISRITNDVEALAVYTNNPPGGAMRGFGANQAHFAIEGCLDLLARAAGLDGWEMRWRNIVDIGDRFGTGPGLDKSVGARKTLAAVKDQYYRARRAGRAARVVASPRWPNGGRVRGWTVPRAPAVSPAGAPGPGAPWRRRRTGRS